MPDVQEVFRMATNKVKPDPNALERQVRRQRKAARSSRSRAYLAVAAIVAAIAVGAVAITRISGPADTTAGDAPSAPPALSDPAAVAVAEGFLDAYALYDAERAQNYLAPGVTTFGLNVTPEQLPLLMAWLESTGYKQYDKQCEVTFVDPANGTDLYCPFRYDNLGSEKLGLGPYGDSAFSFTVLDGKITYLNRSWGTTGFSRQMWEPFLRWVERNYPDDASEMYVTDGLPRFSEASFALWADHVAEYVQAHSR